MINTDVELYENREEQVKSCLRNLKRLPRISTPQSWIISRNTLGRKWGKKYSKYSGCLKPHDAFRTVKISVWFCRKVKGGKIIQDWAMKGLLHYSKETELHLRKQEVTERGSHKKLGNWMSTLQRWRSCTTDCWGARKEAGKS